MLWRDGLFRLSIHTSSFMIYRLISLLCAARRHPLPGVWGPTYKQAKGLRSLLASREGPQTPVQKGFRRVKRVKNATVTTAEKEGEVFQARGPQARGRAPHGPTS